MKILAVLSALATIAIAAPAYEEYTHNTRYSPRDYVITQQREKKSTPLETQQLLEHHTPEQPLTNIGASNADARTFSGFKKPIIVKKKIGYHVYRDSEEEQLQANSQENCKKEVKAKICDDNNSKEKVKSTSNNHSHGESKMEHNINIAKEAVHTFERDLQKMEQDCAENKKHRHGTFESDIQLHQDIEKARQALEHIHRKFKNFDLVTTTDDETTSKVNSKTIKSDEERMIQWKEAGNLYKNIEVGRNLEDNFKFTDHKDESKHLKFNHVNANDFNDANKVHKTAIEDIDATTRSNNKFEDEMPSIVEDKNRKLEIHSDSLIKDSRSNVGAEQKEEKFSSIDHHSKEPKMNEKNTEPNNHETFNHNQQIQETRERTLVDSDNKSNFVELKGNDLNTHEKHVRNHVENKEMLETNGDSSLSDNHARMKVLKESQKLTHENDQVVRESSHVDTVSTTHNNKNAQSEDLDMIHKVTSQNNKDKEHLDHDKFEHRTSMLKDPEFVTHNRQHLRNDENIKDTQKLDVQHSTAQNFKSDDEKKMDIQRSTMAISNLDNKESEFKSHIDSHGNSELTHLRATNDFNKELLNNMEFTEDSHHMAFHHPSDKGQMMKNEKPELHERLNVLRVHPNSEHLKTMMHFSDNSHNVSPHLRFNNEESNINLQFNSPQDFVEQTNVQELMPFRATGDLHESIGLDRRLKSMHEKEAAPTELQDPLKVHWAHSDNMRMDGSSQHFNIEKLTNVRGSSMNDQHLNLNEQMRTQQRWAQAKNINAQQLSPMNTGSEHLHAQNTFSTRNIGHDSSVQPNAFNQMRGAPKMSLEYTNNNQWAHNHGAYRSSYGPSVSYGSGGGSAYSGSAVGVFPNANVGNCAVPILLSCSPSVVSGSLAKTQNAYSAPSYRSEDGNFLKKRGVDIDEATPGLKLQHATLGHRPNVILEKNNNTA